METDGTCCGYGWAVSEGELFELDPRAADRVVDMAFTEYRARVQRSGQGFDARSLVTGWASDDLAEEMSQAQIIACIAYYAFTNDDNLRRPAGFRFNKALLAVVAGGWFERPGVAAVLRHESAPGIELLGGPRPAEEIYPDVEDTWAASVRALHGALVTLVDMGNDLLSQARLSWSWVNPGDR